AAPEAYVPHDRGHHPVPLQAAFTLHLLRAHQHDGVAVDDLAVAVDEDRAVAVAVVGNAERIAAVDDRARELPGCRRSDFQVDVAAVRLAPDAPHLEPQL